MINKYKLRDFIKKINTDYGGYAVTQFKKRIIHVLKLILIRLVSQ